MNAALAPAVAAVSDLGAVLIHEDITIARENESQLAFLVSDISDHNLEVLADRLMRTVGAISFNQGDVRLSLTSSLGIPICPGFAATPQELIAQADAAMYQAKDAGKYAWRTCRPDHVATLRQRSLVTWNDRIRHALPNEGLEIHLQGIFDATTRRRQHHEALLRMRDEPGGKLLLPGAFIAFAEKSNLIIDLDRSVIAHVIDVLAADPSLEPVAVNVSGRSIDDPGMPDFILDLHDTGCKVCLDDFGAGFSTFA